MWPVCRADNLTTVCAACLETLEALSAWNPKCLCRSVLGLFTFTFTKFLYFAKNSILSLNYKTQILCN